MGKPKLQLEGKTFNRLTVIKFSYIKNNRTYWECQCSCPNKTIIVVLGTHLVNGNTKSCGCINIERLVAGTLPPEHHKNWRHENYIKHRDKVLVARKEYVEEHHEEILEKARLDRQMNLQETHVKDKLAYRRKKKRNYFIKPEIRFRNSIRLARKRKINWELTEDEYKSLIANLCYYCTGSLALSGGIGLDRINNDKSIGYKVGNVLPCCAVCNQTRGASWTVEETKIMINAVLEFKKKNVSS